jgi:hypothetical protein
MVQSDKQQSHLASWAGVVESRSGEAITRAYRDLPYPHSEPQCRIHVCIFTPCYIIHIHPTSVSSRTCLARLLTRDINAHDILAGTDLLHAWEESEAEELASLHCKRVALHAAHSNDFVVLDVIAHELHRVRITIDDNLIGGCGLSDVAKLLTL